PRHHPARRPAVADPWCGPGEDGVYHGSGLPSRKTPPVGPPSGRVAAHTTPAAPSATGRPPLPPMSVATHPGQTALTKIPASRSSAASTRVKAFNAALETL